MAKSDAHFQYGECGMTTFFTRRHGGMQMPPAPAMPAAIQRQEGEASPLPSKTAGAVTRAEVSEPEQTSGVTNAEALGTNGGCAAGDGHNSETMSVDAALSILRPLWQAGINPVERGGKLVLLLAAGIEPNAAMTRVQGMLAEVLAMMGFPAGTPVSAWRRRSW